MKLKHGRGTRVNENDDSIGDAGGSPERLSFVWPVPGLDTEVGPVG